jgi:sec-independent protein translocase protein TatC
MKPVALTALSTADMDIASLKASGAGSAYLSPMMSRTHAAWRASTARIDPAAASTASALMFGACPWYALVLPPAVRFLQGFNHGAFDALVQARDYYRFELTTMLALGAIFQLPVVMLVLGRVGLLGSATLRAKRRYAVVALAALPGTGPVTALLELVPLLALYELSIFMLRMSERRRPSVPE